MVFNLFVLVAELLDQDAVLFVFVTKLLDDILSAQVRLDKLAILLVHPGDLFVYGCVALDKRCAELLYVFEAGACILICSCQGVSLLLG